MDDPTLDDFHAAIDAVLRSAGVKKSRKIQTLNEAWSRAQPADIAGHTRVADVAQGTLIVEVDTHPLLQELQGFRAAECLERMRTESPIALAGIRFRIFSERHHHE